MGDFNEITKSFKKKGGRLRSERQMKDFRTTLEDCGLNDLGFIGRWFTWERGRFAATNIRERLDRGVATLGWVSIFPYYQLEHLCHSFSDHCPILLDTIRARWEVRRRSNEAKPFRFEAKWCLDSSFEGRVRRWWEDIFSCVPNKLERIGLQMQKWSKLKDREEKKTRVDLEAKLNSLYQREVSNETLEEIMEVQLGINLEVDKEEIYWEQRARVNWLKNGDRNTKYFHSVAVQRHLRGRISALENENGRRVYSTSEFIKIASDYFGKLFFASEMGSDEHLFGLVEKRVSDSMNARLLQQFTETDVANAVKSTTPLKAPGVDGFPVIFFQRYWHIIGKEISTYCLSILHGQTEIGDINKTRIVLIPKVDKPKNMSQFRPISLCTVIYKIVAKVLVDRMSDTLRSCINEAQGAFIPGRLISDVLIAYEILHSLKMKRRGKKGNFALKLDMSKAYDHVEWDFLAGMMKHLGFHVDWIVLIMRYVCSVSYSVSLNGVNSDWFFSFKRATTG